MNQKNILFAPILAFAIAANANAQGNFGDNNFQNQTWNDSQQSQQFSTVGRGRSTVPPPSSSPTFPSTPIAFDPAIKKASFESDRQAVLNPVSSSALEANLDTAATSFSNLKDNLSQKSTELLESFGAEGSLSGKLQSVFGGTDIGRMLASLSLVLGGYFALVWLMRKFNVGGNRGLPAEVLEIVGHTPFGPRQNLQLIRLGSKLLLLLNGPDGTHPIGEITDQLEVDHLVSLCSNKRRSARPATIRQAPAPRLESHPQQPVQSTSLKDVLRALDKAQTNGTLFEA